jgi:hypothetical protein
LRFKRPVNTPGGAAEVSAVPVAWVLCADSPGGVLPAAVVVDFDVLNDLMSRSCTAV